MANLRIAFVVFAILPIFTIFYDLTHGYHDLANYFSTFTVLSNLLASGIFFYLAFAGLNYKRRLVDSLRGASIGYLLFAGIVYFLLLRNLPEDPSSPTIRWVNNVLHYVMQAVVIIAWIILPPSKQLYFRESFKWMIFPILYVAYSLVRGQVVNWYPYPFLDPVNGYLPMVPTLATMVVAGLVLSVLIILLGNELMLKKRNG